MDRFSQEYVAAAFRVAELAADRADTASAAAAHRERRAEHLPALGTPTQF